ncbi:hypothetical protein E4Q23_12360 [Candidatus Accumulibacter phosphatis]|uniref:PEP-CTERM protein-sorting domain-containing protein n=1 Tax=Candidatus Accumulibacter phosphatis TaxID=327160 RepID=A0ABX1U0U1_9PROT|nr:hypothetical protein [Candidatus Accumulibacter phosphatis]NMQ28473.1 hypothetical protein [Candidatus Accumulibacter phosphatis]
MKLRHVVIPAAAMFLAVQGAANATVVYFNDFESAIGPELALTSGSGTLGLDADTSPASKFLGLNDALANGGLGNNQVTLSLTGLPAHSAITVSFDAYIMRSMDGGFNCCGPDYFVFNLGTFTRTTTFGGPTQAFPNFLETGGTPSDNATYTGGTYTGSGEGVFFPVTFTIPDAGSAVAMSFSMNGLQGVFDEGWGLDNLRVEVNGAVSEPSTNALLAIGALAFGIGSRRRSAQILR